MLHGFKVKHPYGNMFNPHGCMVIASKVIALLYTSNTRAGLFIKEPVGYAAGVYSNLRTACTKSLAITGFFMYSSAPRDRLSDQ